MFKLFCSLVVLAVSVERANAYALLGPFDDWQERVISYQFPGDIGGPMNWGEEFRRNTPTMYYTFDANFLDYFGSNGVAAIEEAISVFNGLTNVSTYTADLSEWPLEAQSFNFQAQALNLTDLKSAAMHLIVEQLGLAEPDRYVWALHDRQVGAGGCPANVGYTVIKRNFDPAYSPLDELQPTSYVNGTLYSYIIRDICSGSPWLADAVEFPVDPLANTFTAIAAGNIQTGAYFTGLTRDDVGGLRYLLRTNNMNTEAAGTDTLTAVTNLAVTQLLFTSNLTLLVNQSLTNDAAALQTLYPNLVIRSETPIFTNVVTTNVFFYFTNIPWAPAGTFGIVQATNRTTNVVTWFSRTFENVVTNTYYTKGWVTVLTTNISSSACGATAPAGLVCTNVTMTRVFTNLINGDYYILPTNSQCGVSIIRTQLTSVTRLTNDAVFATNAPGTVVTNGSQFSQSLIFFFTNRAFVINPVPCVSNSLAVRQGIERIRFVRRDYDSLLNRFFYPITNEYTLTDVTNSIPVKRKVRRIITVPDMLITAEDLASVPADPALGASYAARTISYGTNGAGANLVGPGTIDNKIVFTFNKVGPIFANFTPFDLDEATQTPVLTWGSFDGSTNAPTVYPNGRTVLDLENQVFIQVSPVYLPEGFITSTVLHTNFFNAQLSVASYTPAFVLPAAWAIAPGSLGLPPGLTLSTVDGTNAVITGTPTETGNFDFTLRLTDSQAHTTDRSYFIKINP